MLPVVKIIATLLLKLRILPGSGIFQSPYHTWLTQVDDFQVFRRARTRICAAERGAVCR